MQFTHEQEVEVLEKAYELLKSGWCKELAKNAKGLVWRPQGEFVPVKPTDPKSETVYVPATEWSLGGALMFAELLVEKEHTGFDRTMYPNTFRSDAKRFVEVSVAERGYVTLGALANFNDPDKSRATRKKEDILAVMSEALELARAEGVALRSSEQ